jgi:hypothetical protein
MKKILIPLARQKAIIPGLKKYTMAPVTWCRSDYELKYEYIE